MNSKESTNKPVRKERIGKFQISLWNGKRVIKDDAFQVDRVVDQSRICLQYSQFNLSMNKWENQQIWCNADDIRDLVNVLDRLNDISIEAQEES